MLTEVFLVTLPKDYLGLIVTRKAKERQHDKDL